VTFFWALQLKNKGAKKLKKKVVSLILVLALCLFTNNVVAVEGHWAAGDLYILKEIYKFEVIGNLDEPADKALQEEVFKLIGLKKRPRHEMLRFRIFYYMVESLPIEKLGDEECNEMLQDFADFCDYCKKNNRTLGMAKKIGLLRGRKTVEGLVMAIDKPVTKAELGVLAVRYLKVKETLK
jgi:hypothetical protein